MANFMRKNFGSDNFSRRSHTLRDISKKRDENRSGGRKNATRILHSRWEAGLLVVVSDTKTRLFLPKSHRYTQNAKSYDFTAWTKAIHRYQKVQYVLH